jgi:hypothetical protein
MHMASGSISLSRQQWRAQRDLDPEFACGAYGASDRAPSHLRARLAEGYEDGCRDYTAVCRFTEREASTFLSDSAGLQQRTGVVAASLPRLYSLEALSLSPAGNRAWFF